MDARNFDATGESPPQPLPAVEANVEGRTDVTFMFAWIRVLSADDLVSQYFQNVFNFHHNGGKELVMKTGPPPRHSVAALINPGPNGQTSSKSI